MTLITFYGQPKWREESEKLPGIAKHPESDLEGYTPPRIRMGMIEAMNRYAFRIRIFRIF
jgi:hypothetical protein